MSVFEGVLSTVHAVIACVAALGVVIARRPLRAAFALLVHIYALAVLYLQLHAHALGVFQLLVYAGAIVVLFVFVIMMIGPGTQLPSLHRRQGMIWRTLGGALLGLVMGALISIVLEDSRSWPDLGSKPSSLGTLEALAWELFERAWLPFELVSALLLVAVVGAMTIAGQRSLIGGKSSS